MVLIFLGPLGIAQLDAARGPGFVDLGAALA